MKNDVFLYEMAMAKKTQAKLSQKDENRIADLEALQRRTTMEIGMINKQWREDYGSTLLIRSEIISLHSICREICVKLGVSPVVFEECFQERTNIFHHEFLKRIEDRFPDEAGHVDFRKIEDVPTTKNYKPLFPED